MNWYLIKDKETWEDSSFFDDTEYAEEPASYPVMAGYAYGTDVVFFYIGDAVELIQGACDILYGEI